MMILSLLFGIGLALALSALLPGRPGRVDFIRELPPDQWPKWARRK